MSALIYEKDSSIEKSMRATGTGPLTHVHFSCDDGGAGELVGQCDCEAPALSVGDMARFLEVPVSVWR